MSAQLITPAHDQTGPLRFYGMCLDDLDEVLAIERDIYPFPWTRGNFRDSLDAGYYAWTLREQGVLVGYAVLMQALDEAHLLNISVSRAHQGRGLGRLVMDRVVAQMLAYGAQSVLLEVRPSNARALRFYDGYGFERIGVRRGYYPADASFPNHREDAIVMRLTLTQADHA
jgi:ribosomal-protein-alanine N-acetyltransferase